VSIPTDDRRAEGPQGPSTDDLNRSGSHADRAFGLGWIALGLGIVAESWRMDRLEQQHINPWTIPGLLPGLLGVVLALFGLVLALRAPRDGVEAGPLELWRAALAVALCLGFAGGLVGSGLPFWAAAFGFVFLAILLFEWPDRGAAALPRAGLVAAATTALVTLVFQEVFLVRLP
jgi:hypothetical protein